MAGLICTQHAQSKFEVLRRHGFEVTPEQVEQTVTAPDRVALQSGRTLIAQKRITDRHILRVIYREEGDTLVVIAFFPGRRDRYEATV